MAYNPVRKIRLGGISGEISINGQPSSYEARRLVWGQYLGIGKNSRFGFGFFRIPALDSIRSIMVYPKYLKL
jgi:CRISPR/Cas system endoribonuclease Cas6 (RAMP superfamily)